MKSGTLSKAALYLAKLRPKQTRATSDFLTRKIKVIVIRNTFRQGVASILDAAAGLEIDGYTQQDATDILNEIVQLQRYGVLDDGTTPVREHGSTHMFQPGNR